MTDEIAEIIGEEGKDFISPNKYHLWATELSNGYFVSTIKRTEAGKMLDKAITMAMKVHGVTEADLGRPRKLDMEGDYETMVFIGDGRREVGFARYATEEEAKAGHKEMVERWRRMPSPE